MARKKGGSIIAQDSFNNAVAMRPKQNLEKSFNRAANMKPTRSAEGTQVTTASEGTPQNTGGGSSPKE